MKAAIAVLVFLSVSCASPQAVAPPPVTAGVSSAPVVRHPVKLVVTDQRPGTDARLINQLEGYVRRKLEKAGVVVDPTATQLFEVQALPPQGRCARAGGRVFGEGGEAFAFPVVEQRCKAPPGGPFSGEDPLSEAVAMAYAIIASDEVSRNDFQTAVDVLVTRLLLKIR